MNELAELLGRLDPARLAAVVSMLPAAAVHAVLVGADVALDRAGAQLDDRLAEDYIGRWHRANQLAEITALDLARYPPTGNREEWILYGGAGRPPHPLPNDEKAAAA